MDFPIIRPTAATSARRSFFTKIWDIAKEYDIPYVAEASNLDDNGDYRPGLMAVAELSVLSPLREVGMNKSMIRELSHGLGLPTWNKQSFACLSSRFVYGEEITEERLGMVDRAEQLLLDAGFHRCVCGFTRAERTRLPVSRSAQRILQKMFAGDFYQEVNAKCKEIGFTYVTAGSRRIPDGKHERRHPESIILKLHRI